ncbi:MAG: homocysteine S-methyltransferase family protein, partial [Ignavibacteriaceae bacterium]|nr:homocysteine S-methyltransferase family protein [Ignavibacteriaceae bacterium]
IISEHCDRNNIPYLISLYLTEDYKLLSGESVGNILTFLSHHNPIAIGFNCISYETLIEIIGSTELPTNWGFYLNCGSGHPTDHLISCGIDPEEYSNYVKNSLHYKPVFVGSCCGSTPEHTKRIRKLLDKLNDS